MKPVRRNQRAVGRHDATGEAERRAADAADRHPRRPHPRASAVGSPQLPTRTQSRTAPPPLPGPGARTLMDLSIDAVMSTARCGACALPGAGAGAVAQCTCSCAASCAPPSPASPHPSPT